MSVSHTAYLIVGADPDEIDFSKLKGALKTEYLDWLQDKASLDLPTDFHEDGDEKIDEDWKFEEYCHLLDDSENVLEFLRDEWDGILFIGNAYAGYHICFGYPIYPDAESTDEKIEKAKLRFKEFFDIEPDLYLEVDTW